MKYILEADFKGAWGDIYAGRVIQVEDSGVAGVIMDKNGKFLAVVSPRHLVGLNKTF